MQSNLIHRVLDRTEWYFTTEIWLRFAQSWKLDARGEKHLLL